MHALTKADPVNRALEKRALLAALAVMAVYLSPLFLLGEDAHLRVHDNLDSNIAWYKVLHASGEWFGKPGAVVPQVIGGLPRAAYGTEFSGLLLLHKLFPSMTAYAVSQAVTRLFAFLGMYLLLRDHLVREPDAWPIRAFVALAFALTPFWPSGMLSTLGQPLALWAFLSIRAGRAGPRHWLTLALLPFYASFVLGFFFFLAAMGLLWLRDAIVKKNANVPFLTAIIMMTGIFLLVEYRLLLSLVLSGEPTSRNEFVSSRLGLWRCVRLAVKNFVLGHHHVATIHTFVILPVLLLAFYLVIGERRRGGTERRFLALLALNAVLSVWYAFWFHRWWQPLKEAVSLFNTFNFARFHFLRPLVIYAGFALGLAVLWRYGRAGRALVSLALAAQVLLSFAFNEEVLFERLGEPTFRQFYAERQFAAIRDRIGLPQETYRVASIGLHPAIAQYNGFYTLDTYNNFYPLSYKHRFRQIIAKELDKNRKLKEYFDTWGGRCYIFVAELGKKYDFRKTSTKRIRNLELDTKVFWEMGGRYLFSALPIDNAADNGLALFGVFDDAESAWRVYVYEVMEGGKSLGQTGVDGHHPVLQRGSGTAGDDPEAVGNPRRADRGRIGGPGKQPAVRG
jgi:hypothetical protein